MEATARMTATWLISVPLVFAGFACARGDTPAGAGGTGSTKQGRDRDREQTMRQEQTTLREGLRRFGQASKGGK